MLVGSKSKHADEAFIILRCLKRLADLADQKNHAGATPSLQKLRKEFASETA